MYSLFCLIVLISQAEGAVFLRITPGARAIGMCQSFTAIADDATACYYNPAGIAFIDKPQVLSMNLSPPIGIAKAGLWTLTELSHPIFGQKVHSPLDPSYLGGPYIYWASVLPLDCRQSVGININYVNFGPTDAYDSLFYSYNYALSASYGRKIMDNLGLGISIKYIYEFFYPQWILDSLGWAGKSAAQSFAFDGGVLFRSQAIGLSIGASLLNFGPPIQYPEYVNNASRKLPLTGRVGIAQSITDLLETASENSSTLRKTNCFLDFTITVERKFDLCRENPINNTTWGFETKIFNVLSYRQGFGLTKEENFIFADPKSIGFDLGIVEFDVTVTNSSYYCGNWWIQSNFKPLADKPRFLQDNKTLDQVFLNLSCLAIPGGGQLYNGDKWKALPFLVASFIVADAILERDARPEWQNTAAIISLPILYLGSCIEANLAVRR